MFLEFYKIREQPFGVTPDPRFLFLGASHREALASLFCGIEADRGFMALIAHPGMGKTTLTFQLLEKFQASARTVFLFQTQCTSHELFKYVLNDLEIDSTGMDMVSMHNKLNDVLYREKQAGRRFVLAIDEAQNLDPEVLETIRLLSNFETSRTKLLQILLIGQPQLAHKLAQPSLLQLEQRITVFARLEQFSPEDTFCYIDHRLRVAGYDGDPLFTSGALRTISEQSQGIPRNINKMCFSALSLGCAMGRKRIDAEIMEEVVADLDVESLTGPVIKHLASHPKVNANSILSYRMKPKRRLGRLALGAVGIAAAIALGVVMPSFRNRINRFWPIKAETRAAVRASSPSAGGFADAPSASIPISSRNEKVDEALNSSAPSIPPSKDPKTVKIVVQSGETLRQITLRTLGRYDNRLIEQIQNLNPRITNPNHIETDQEIRIPQVSKPSFVPNDDGANEMSRKTEEQE